MSTSSNRAKLRIFLCHASEDKPQVADLYRRLKDAGYHPWLDKYDLMPGLPWRREIKKIIRDPYNLVLVCLSNNSVTKRGVAQQEIKWALDILERMPEGTIYLIPVRLEVCKPPDQLAHLHWVDLFEPDGFEFLKRALDYEISRRHPPAEQAQPKLPKILSPRHPFEPELILIPAGTVRMGTDRLALELAGVQWQDWMKREAPPHQLSLPAYTIGRYPVTNAEYTRFIQDGGYHLREFWTEVGWQVREREGWTQPRFWTEGKWNQATYPVVGVSWYECVAYCRWLRKTSGRPYRLPTEAEWEKAARGPNGSLWPWGNHWDPNCCNTSEKGPRHTTPVGQYSPVGDSHYGVADMVGNTWEWCATKWGKTYPYNTTEDEWAVNYLEGADSRVLRGGSWSNYEDDARCTCRSRNLNDNWSRDVGFRVVASPSQ